MDTESGQLKKFILEKYKFRTELHAHTSPVSSCGDFDPDEVIRRYAKIGYNAIAITNHFTYQYRFERFSKEPTAEEFVELRFSENQNDYLAYGIDEDTLLEIYDRLPYGIAEFRNSDRLKGVLLIQAHRFRDNMEDIDPMYVDGIETFNMHNGHNSRIRTIILKL